MLAQVQKMLDDQSAMYTDGAFQAAASYFCAPLPLHTKTELSVHKNPDEIVGALRKLVSLYQANGVRHVRWDIAAIDIPRRGKFRVWVNWDHILTDRVIECASQLTYYCQLQDDQLQVQMVHFLQTPLDPVGAEPALYLRRA